MKQYSDYMDRIEVSDTLHQKLVELEAPKKRTAAWKKYGVAAAALVLVAGAGAYGLTRGEGGWDAITKNFRPAAEVAPGKAEIPAPDIAIVDPNGPIAPPDWRDAGYEVVYGEGPDAMVAYYFLPNLLWTDASALSQSALNYSLAPPGAVQRDATWDDVRMFAGGEKAMANHLLWDEGMGWGGTLWFEEDGTPCAAELYSGYTNKLYGMRLYLEIRKGHEVPSCIVFPDEYYETSRWQGVKITAVKNGGYTVTDDGVELREKREVSFFCDGTGYKLTLYANDARRADELCARFVRYAVDGGFRLDALSNHGTVGASGYEDGAPAVAGGNDYPDCPYCADGTAHTHPYDPNVAAEAKAPTPSN